MAELMSSTPVVMSISDHDPCGGAGISAAIETISSLGCHCTPIISQLLACDTHEHKDRLITDTHFLIEQIRAILEDIPVNVLSIGHLGSTSNIEAVHTILKDYPKIAVVFNRSNVLSGDQPEYNDAIRHLILPLTTITILNNSDVLSMAKGGDTLAACAQGLIADGCENLLAIGSTQNQSTRNHWFSHHGQQQSYDWPSVADRPQGANDTLAAALSAYVAHGLSLAESIQQAQKFTQQTLLNSRRIGMGKPLPNRMFWCKK